MATTSKKKVVVGVKAPPSKKVGVLSSVTKKTRVSPNVTKEVLPVKSVSKPNRRVIELQDHESTGNVRIAITDATKKLIEKKNEIVQKSEMQLARLSPFRFPALNQHYVGNVARTAGVFFTIVGAFFTLLNLQIATGTFSYLDPLHNTAQISGVPTNTTSATGGETTSSSIDTTPDVRISIESTDTLNGTIPVVLTVPYATRVSVLARNTETGTLTPLGSAVVVDNSTWRYYWDTKNLPNGGYRLYVTIENSYGTYEDHDSTSYTVLNVETEAHEQTTSNIVPPTTGTLSSTTADTEETEVSTTTSEDPLEVTTPQQGVSLDISSDAPLHGRTPLRVSVVDATEVKVYARNTSTYVLYYLGFATHTSGNEWKLDWRTATVPDGTYFVVAKATVGGVVLESPRMQTSVDNVEEKVVTTITTTATTTVEQPVTTTAIEPTIAISVLQSNPLHDYVDITIATSPVDQVELYVLPKGSLTQRFLGRGTKVGTESTAWKYTWMTTHSPNGDYDLYARVRTSFGYTESKRLSVRVKNEIVEAFSSEEEESIDAIMNASDALTTEVDDDELLLKDQSAVSGQESSFVYIQTVDSFLESVEIATGTQSELSITLSEFRDRLNEKQVELAYAVRNSDESKIQTIKNDIERMKNDILQKLPSTIENKEIIDRINGFLSQVAFQLIELTTNNEKLLRDRIGDLVFTDSDTDSVSDYDEIHLYQTNPTVADTDGDGYLDGSEITLGYNPLDAKAESSIAFESALDAGITRDDLLAVYSITTVVPDESLVDEKGPIQAVISGKGLPNSFVTLYIYSTPIVVTVKTDAEGNWTYTFDKDLESGTHEVYAGITDNTGRIVAKSTPFSFVKTAEAFTVPSNPVTQVLTVESPEPSFFESRALILIASICVVALGLVLMLLGLHVRERRDDLLPLAEPTATLL